MRVRAVLLAHGAALAACGGSHAPPRAVPLHGTAPVAPPPPGQRDPRLDDALAPLYERMVPIVWGSKVPAFDADNALVLGAYTWDAAGRYRGRNQLSIEGQLEAVAMARGKVLGIGWSDLYQGSSTSWLVIGSPDQTAAAAAHFPIGAAYDPTANETQIIVAPDAARVALIEDTRVVIRELATGAELASAPIPNPDVPHLCWASATRIAWRDATTGWTTLDATRGATAAHQRWTAPAALACDAAGGAAVTATPAGIVETIDLVTGAVIARLAAPPPRPPHAHPVSADEAADPDVDDPLAPDRVAVADHGRRVAVARLGTVAIYDAAGGAATFTRRFALAWDPRANAGEHGDAGDLARVTAPPGADQLDWSTFFSLRFSPDATRLAVVGSGSLYGASLLVIGPASAARALPEAPALAVALPNGFVALPPTGSSPWPALGISSGALRLPAQLLHAQQLTGTFAEATVTVVDADELRDHLPAPTADAHALADFAGFAMQRFSASAHWSAIGDPTTIPAPGPRTATADLTLAVGQTETAVWSDSRDLVRDGCEPYDDYTRIVFDRDRDVIFIVQAFTVPGGPITGWLSVFLDAPFHLQPSTARRRGPSTGPC